MTISHARRARKSIEDRRQLKTGTLDEQQIEWLASVLHEFPIEDLFTGPRLNLNTEATDRVTARFLEKMCKPE